MKVLAALSGGVDSAVAAARAVDAGHEVAGVHMALRADDARSFGVARGCYSAEHAEDARGVAEALEVPFSIWDLSEEFEAKVVSDFLSEYSVGRTPNPCVRCNQHIKFDALLERAIDLGFDALVTGHYARIVRPDPAIGRLELHRAADAAKDQSYVLAALGVERLARVMFPLGESGSKAEVRAEAAARGIKVSDKPDSYDICFIGDGDVAGFLRRAFGERVGEIVDGTGEVVGEHRGAYAFTVGQRKGLRLPRPASDGEPRYVVEVRTETNTVVVGPVASLDTTTLHGTDIVWLADDVSASAPTPCHVQVRAHAIPAKGHVTIRGDAMVIELDEPMRKVAAGQALVVYDGSRVLGQATASVWRS